MLAGVLVGAAAFAGPRYAIIDSGPHDVADTYDSRYSINAAGTVVDRGVFPGSGWRHATRIDTDGQVTDLGALGGSGSKALGINDGGDIVGTVFTASGSRGFVFDQTGLRTFGVLWAGALSRSEARAINNFGQVHNPGATSVRAVSIAGAISQGYINQAQASAACANAGKRLCTDTEWLRACRTANAWNDPYGPARVDPFGLQHGLSLLRRSVIALRARRLTFGHRSIRRSC